jgi:citrate lyase subunit beta/citryl-CoA lyase
VELIVGHTLEPRLHRVGVTRRATGSNDGTPRTARHPKLSNDPVLAGPSLSGDIVLARSFLYVPGDRPERFAKAVASGTDAVIFDLEDAVPVGAKDFARNQVHEFLHSPTPGVEAWVRVNSGLRGNDDLDAMMSLDGLTGVFLPKATPATARDALQRTQGRFRLCPLVESAAGILEVATIAGLWVDRLAIGEVDLAADLGMSTSADGREFEPLRLDLVVASAAHGRPPPIGPVWTDIADQDGLAASTMALRKSGFGARQAIHPNQVDIINHAMSPTPEELERAASLIELANRAGGGVCTDENGRMIDEAVLRSARRLLEP